MNVPSEALRFDGTALEDVSVARNAGLGIPISWMLPLGKALKAGSVWVRGGKIVGGHTSALWERALKQGAILLDATPEIRAVADVMAAGGKVLGVIAETTNLKITQVGPTLYGRKLSQAEIDRRVPIAVGHLEAAPLGQVAILAHQKVAESDHQNTTSVRVLCWVLEQR